MGSEISLHFWRPITAIHLGDTDGNPERKCWLDPAAADISHAGSRLRACGTEGGVAAEILKQVFGTDDIAFTACSTTVPREDVRGCGAGAPLLFQFLQAANENAVSRIYIGIHFRRAVEEGLEHGKDRRVRR